MGYIHLKLNHCPIKNAVGDLVKGKLVLMSACYIRPYFYYLFNSNLFVRLSVFSPQMIFEETAASSVNTKTGAQ